MTARIFNYIANGGSERDSLLAAADYCAACAQREADMGDPIGMYQMLADEALRLRALATGAACENCKHAVGDDDCGHPGWDCGPTLKQWELRLAPPHTPSR